MELGALVCTARSPRCAACPLVDTCAWLLAGRPADAHADRRRSQAWTGTDRQARGRIMGLLRGARVPAGDVELAACWPQDEQRARALAGLVADGLVEQVEGGYVLPGAGTAAADEAPPTPVRAVR
jgi:A/G-specific adenine glycosylase